jgi:hypothetical protein
MVGHPAPELVSLTHNELLGVWLAIKIMLFVAGVFIADYLWRKIERLRAQVEALKTELRSERDRF